MLASAGWEDSILECRDVERDSERRAEMQPRVSSGFVRLNVALGWTWGGKDYYYCTSC